MRPYHLTLMMLCATACSANPGDADQPSSRASIPDGAEMTEKIEKTDAEWREQLTPEQYRVTREAGTEPAFTGSYWNAKTPGEYACVCCGRGLFDSEAKFDSGTGWPSFYQPVDSGRVSTETDRSLGMERIEVKCSHCDAHLGHMFDDGPEPTGLRYCINSLALDLREQR